MSASAHADFVGTGPDYDAEADVSETCSVCHSLRYLDRAQGYDTADEWSRVIASMVSLPAARDRAISTYLAANYRHKPSKAPTLIEGDTNIVIDEWLTPSLGQRTRDPIEAPDGDIWWTGMWASLVGRLDPTTGAMQEFLLPSAARPHSIVPDRDGFIWYTGNSNATIGKLDPATGEIIEYPTQARDPHTAVFHPNGNLYFTSQHSNMLGRLNPTTGEVTEIDTRRKPYGIKVGQDNDLFVAFNGTNAIGRMNP
ncbi:cytochrome C, partial [Luminiphilus sp.]|nr:cytochrome C [Luminiphilus sp.]